MFAVIFEVDPRTERFDDYLRYAASLRPELERIDGFLENRRFRSRRHPGRLLSLSLWRDEKSVIRWRTHGGHHAIQDKGRTEVFRDYHLRVGEIVIDNGEALAQYRLDETETGASRAVSIIEMPDAEAPPIANGLVEWDMFDGVLDPNDQLLLLSWHERSAMDAWRERGGKRRRDVRVVRDYGLHSRAEAPQFHPPVAS
jgi:heme-degrading monooxygenase HmoA